MCVWTSFPLVCVAVPDAAVLVNFFFSPHLPPSSGRSVSCYRSVFVLFRPPSPGLDVLARGGVLFFSRFLVNQWLTHTHTHLVSSDGGEREKIVLSLCVCEHCWHLGKKCASSQVLLSLCGGRHHEFTSHSQDCLYFRQPWWATRPRRLNRRECGRGHDIHSLAIIPSEREPRVS